MANHVCIIAEAGVNHNGSLEMAKELVDVAADAGADFVKFQTFKAEKLVSKNAPKARYQNQTTDSSETQLEMIKKLEMNEEFHRAIISHCEKKKVQFLSTPFDFDSINLLAKTFDLPSLKMASGEITNAPLLLKAANTRKKIIISSGMSTLGEIEAALGVLAFGYLFPKSAPSIELFQHAYFSEAGAAILQEKISLLHCTTEYPAPFVDVNLFAMDTLKVAFGLPVGISDHTKGIAIPIAAVARGATIVEKHFTLDKTLPGPDHQASLEPNELKNMVNAIREVELALGSSQKKPAASEYNNLQIARKSIVASQNIKKGERFSSDNLTAKRPGTGLSPLLFWQLLNKTANKDYSKDEIIIL